VLAALAVPATVTAPGAGGASDAGTSTPFRAVRSVP